MRTKDKKQSLAGAVRERLTYIEHQLHIGFSQIDLVDELKEEGFEISYDYFRQLLQRARKKAKENSIKIEPLADEVTKETTEKQEEIKRKSFKFNSSPDKSKLI